MKIKRPRILVIGANPALQKNLLFRDFRPGTVNRAFACSSYASGKGINFLKAANIMQNDCTLLQFSGSEEGAFITRELDNLDISHLTINTVAATRSCITCLNEQSSEMTELIEPSGEITSEEKQLFCRILEQNIDKFDAVAACGTCPASNSDSEELYNFIAKTAQKNNKPLLLDACMNTHRALNNNQIEILKINFTEAQELTKTKNIFAVISYFRRNCKIRHIAITDGPNKAYLAGCGGEILSFYIPQLNNVKNPLGAGDTASAALLTEFLKTRNIAESFTTALAAASASCLSLYCADFNLETLNKIKKQIIIRKITPPTVD